MPEPGHVPRRERLRIERTVHIEAAPETVWQVWLDVERWPDWSDSVTEVQRVDEGLLAVGKRVRIKQPKMLAMVWRVSDLDPGKSFVWIAKMAGVTTVAGHKVEPAEGDGAKALTGHHSKWPSPFTDMEPHDQ